MDTILAIFAVIMFLSAVNFFSPYGGFLDGFSRICLFISGLAFLLIIAVKLIKFIWVAL